MFKTSDWFTEASHYGNTVKVPRWGMIAGSAIGALVVLIILFDAFGTVSAGQVGIKTRFSSVVGTLQPGLYFKVPFIEGVETMDVQTQKEQVKAVEAASQDLQTVTT